MVAAWISAETGVGPAMASGSHTCSGNCADLPIAPPNSSRAPAVRRNCGISPCSASSVMCPMFVSNPAATVRTKMPNRNGMSPVRVVMKALIEASEFVFSSHQCPIRK